MKRDLELIRKMALAIDDAPPGWAADMEFAGYEAAQVGYHAYLLIDAGLAKGRHSASTGDESPTGFITGLTDAGHGFAEAAKDDSRWEKALDMLQGKADTVPLGILGRLLAGIMKGNFGPA